MRYINKSINPEGLYYYKGIYMEIKGGPIKGHSNSRVLSHINVNGKEYVEFYKEHFILLEEAIQKGILEKSEIYEIY